MLPLIVTGYTPDYEWAADRLAEDVDRLGMSFLAIPYEDCGAWHLNCRQKPGLIASALKRRPLLWIDADGRLLRRPHLLDSTRFRADLALCPSRAKTGRKWCTGTIYVTPAAKWFLHQWVGYATVKDTDEQAINAAWKGVPLPHTYGLSRLYGWLPVDGPPKMGVVIQHELSGNASLYQAERGGSK
jgi:hypothetical protein